MHFETEIESLGDNYHLGVATFYKDPDVGYPQVIHITVRATKLGSDERYAVVSFELLYKTLNREYLPFSDIWHYDQQLYDDVIELLNATYGDLWGFIPN